MARVAGVNIADRKHTVSALQQICGIGGSRARKICDETNVPGNVMVKDLTEEQLELAAQRGVASSRSKAIYAAKCR